MLNNLRTPQAPEIGKTPWNCYPRPQLRRKDYVNLNGSWDFHISTEGVLPQTYSRQILVPFCPESALSGLQQTISPGSYLFYRRRLPSLEGDQGKRVLLHVGAADQEVNIYVNHQEVGFHQGGYTAFTVDITDPLTDENELVIRCRDDLHDHRYPYGKQTLKRGGMWYTPVSGIWQTVWLEVVPREYIQTLDIQSDTEGATITVTPALDGTLHCEGNAYPLTGGTVRITPTAPRLWTPETPYLYDFTIETDEDRVESYFALRSITSQVLNGIPRLCLNGKPYFFHGLLDQGYWPDGIYTPATPKCYADDILAMKQLGFNTLRKHIKVEPEEFYYQCDRLGMVVFQDMVNNGDYSFLRDTILPTIGLQKRGDKRLHRDKETRRFFLQTMRETVAQLKNHPSILYWTIFNEGWGQFDSDGVYRQLKRQEPNRIIDSTSGWFRRKKSDVDSRHIYFGSWKKLKPSHRPLVLSEFGGYTCRVEGHLFNPAKAYGYKTCNSLEDFQQQVALLYAEKVLPAVEQGLCAAIITQVSDVEDEINGFLTYDRRVCKADRKTMTNIAQQLQEVLNGATARDDNGNKNTTALSQ